MQRVVSETEGVLPPAPRKDVATLATEARVEAPAPRYQTLRAANVRTVATEWVKRRPRRSAVKSIVTLGVLAIAGYSPNRLAAILAIDALSFAYIAYEARRAESSVVDERSLFFSQIVLAFAQAAHILITGGIASPFWPSLLATTVGTLSVFGRSRESNISVVVVGALSIAIASVPRTLLGAAQIAQPYNSILWVWAVLYALYMIRSSSFVMGDASRNAGEQLDKLREDVISEAGERAKGLEVVSAKVAHELKNPLSSVKGLVGLLARDAKDDRATERFEVITQEISRMEAILRDYLSYSRPLEDLRTRPVELGVIADDVIAVLEARAANAGVLLERRGASATVVGDARRLKEALLNVIANALEATPSGGFVRVIVREIERGGAEIAIKDNGKGISREELERIGTPFFTTRDGGTGLGVVVARKVVQQHHGEMKYDSEVGRGTTVTISLPFNPADASVGI